jgi:hypothetical protein
MKTGSSNNLTPSARPGKGCLSALGPGNREDRASISVGKSTTVVATCAILAQSLYPLGGSCIHNQTLVAHIAASWRQFYEINGYSYQLQVKESLLSVAKRMFRTTPSLKKTYHLAALTGENTNIINN